MAKTKALKLEQNQTRRVIMLMVTPPLIALAYLLFSPSTAWGVEGGDHRFKREPKTTTLEWHKIAFFGEGEGSEAKADESEERGSTE